MKLELLQIIEDIVSHPGIELTTLKRKLAVDDSKLNNLLKQTNELLKDQGYFPIERQKKQLWLHLNLENVHQLKKAIQNESLHNPDKSMRKYLMILSIFTTTQTALNSFAQQYNVSKNTIMTDMNELKQELNGQKIAISYTRKAGYYFSGTDLEIKKCLISTLHKCFNHNWNERMLDFYFPFLKQWVPFYQSEILKAEEVLNTQFSNRQLQLLSTLLPFIHQRSRNYGEDQQTLTTIGELAATEDYRRIESALFQTLICEGLSPDNQSFIVLQFLSANVIRSKRGENKKLREAINQVISFFEIHSVFVFNERERLLEMLFQHLSPAVYRLKYGIPYEDQDIEKVVDPYSSIFPRVKEALKVIEDIYEIKFTEVEIVYVGLIFQSFLTTDETLLQKERLQAIVVCENGVSVSNLLFQTLSKIFPMLDFVANVSRRDYYNNPIVYSDIKIIFSTVYLKTTKKLFLVSNLLNDEAKLRLIEKVNQDLFDQKTRFDIEKILLLVKKNSQGVDEEQLRKDLLEYVTVSYKNERSAESRPKSNFNQLLAPEFIKFTKRKFSFSEAIQAVAEPLLKADKIEQHFVDTILARYDEQFPYFVIAPGIAIPHAGFSDGVKQIGMSYLQLEHPVRFSKEHQIYGLLMIAPINNTHHQEASQNFYELVSNKTKREKLLSLKAAKSIKAFFELNVD